MDARKSAKRLAFASFLHPLWEFENILQTIAQLIQYTVLKIQFWSVKYTTVIIGYAKISSNTLFLSIQATQAIVMVRLDENKSLKRIWHCIYLFKLYSTSIIIFLKNNITIILGEISKIEMNLRMVYICNMKSSGKYINTKICEEVECTLHF